jgi:DNA-binding beta-propeller fold protein YncE
VGQAVTTVVSPDGKTLLVLTSGYNSQNFTSGPNAGNTNPDESNEYIFAFDISGSKALQIQVLQVPNASDGIVFNPSGKKFYVTGGPSDNVHFCDLNGGTWAESGTPVKLGHTAALGLGTITPGAMGVGITADGKRLVVANYENDSISLIDVAGRTLLGEFDLRPGNGLPGGTGNATLNDTAANQSTANSALGINGAGPSFAVGLNSFYGPWTQQVDLGLARRFVLAERHAITLQVQAFNLLNHANYHVQNGNGVNAIQYVPVGATCGDGASQNQTCYLVPNAGPGGFRTLQIVNALNGPRVLQFAFQYTF